MSEIVDKTVFEKAGFMLFYNDSAVLVTRGNLEFEYVGGKKEKSERPQETAFAELVEEIGMNILDEDWEKRALPFYTFQPFSKKWIWSFYLELTETEFERLQTANKALQEWDETEMRSFEKITGRSELARKAVDRICLVKRKNLIAYVKNFHHIPASKNRMKDAKLYAKTHKLVGVDITTDKQYKRGIRGFNLVVLEQHINKLK